ncbi:LysR family transcriptional regulator [Sinorhizobium meliloti]|jgi:LysR family transcriptional regulator, flagellar master operon regulator|uniref:Transcriptional regulator, LysR family n=3 Tax=Rhizobium meliloti TaxID=382 RepID=Q92YC8_RHIME|nr:LysR family transcriptional regulator [Sinorhizobium meliloti]TWA93491.1 DNA-binding transcriptional LysR family regulator [Ensifer sp. SEMIA 134]TWB29273.1 DNA-binding transcriptional LysR family regulator [Ensifer sp. SEMIA 135]AAK65614.1 Transcriptional regulator, LysR family [Sinorhizobium meliloti 1021]AEG07744.1 transcriptional regulator, LysR family [Sinorhizobium meliloti BL225C]AEH81762.1 Transcriptional regulator, LysR family [Sinorhizobium meliloti SM11]
MNLDLIDTFLDLLETGNFNRTAERLETTQSTISGRVKALEQAVGAKLFQRGRAGAIPTPSGLRFEQHARSLKAGWAHARRDIGGLERYEGSLRVSGQFSLLRTLFLDWIGELHATNKRVALHLEADYSTQIISDLANGAIDIGVVFAPKFLPDLSIEEIGAQRLVMVSTEFANVGNVTADRYIRASYTAYIERAHAELLPHLAHPALTVGYEELAVGIMKRFGGTTYLPEHALDYLASSGVSAKVVEDAPDIHQPVYVATQRRRKHDPLVHRAILALKSVADRHFKISKVKDA